MRARFYLVRGDDKVEEVRDERKLRKLIRSIIRGDDELISRLIIEVDEAEEEDLKNDLPIGSALTSRSTL